MTATAYPDALPVSASPDSHAAGIGDAEAKTAGDTLRDRTKSLYVDELQQIIRNIVGLAAKLGLPDGSTTGSVYEAILGAYKGLTSFQLIDTDADTWGDAQLAHLSLTTGDNTVTLPTLPLVPSPGDTDPIIRRYAYVERVNGTVTLVPATDNSVHNSNYDGSYRIAANDANRLYILLGIGDSWTIHEIALGERLDQYATSADLSDYSDYVDTLFDAVNQGLTTVQTLSASGTWGDAAIMITDAASTLALTMPTIPTLAAGQAMRRFLVVLPSVHPVNPVAAGGQSYHGATAIMDDGETRVVEMIATDDDGLGWTGIELATGGRLANLSAFAAAHVSSASNPHSVTAAQVGAVSAAGHTAKSAIVADASGNIADLTPTTTDRLLGWASGAIAWIQITLEMIPDSLITLPKLADAAAHTILTRSADSTGIVAAQSVGTDEGIFNVAGVLTSQKVKLENIDSTIAAATTSGPGLMSATQVTRQNNLISIADPLSTFPNFGLVTVRSAGSDFPVSGSGTAPYAAASTGAGATTNWGSASGARAGILLCDTGTTTTGITALYGQSAGVLFGTGRWRLRVDARLTLAASDGTDTYTARLGFNDTYSLGGDGQDGAFFRYTHSVNSGNWVCVTRSNSVETTTNTSVAGYAGGTPWQVFSIEANAAGTSVAFYIDGVLVATHTTNIPTGAGRETGICTHILKSAGTANRRLEVDYMWHRFEGTI